MASTPRGKPTVVDANVMVSYTLPQKTFVETYLLANLRKAGIKVWSEAPDAKPKGGSMRAQVLLTCQVYIPVLCSESVMDNQIKDEVSLAYISNKSIIPLGREYFRKVDKNTTSGLKLMLAKINWTFFVKESQYESNLAQLVEVINQEVAVISASPSEGPETEEEVYEALNNHAPDLPRPETGEEEMDTPRFCEHTEQLINCDFWERNFTGKKDVTWVEFKDCFTKDYSDRVTRQLGEDKMKWMVNILYKDIFDLYKNISKRQYLQFTGQNTKADPHLFFERLKEYCIGSFAMREVFDMDSTVRLAAIQNLGKFNNPSVVTLLFDLVSDSDPNIRAVAALALAKTGKKYRRISNKLIQMLEDEDRVVRESACLSLAHMKCTQAVPNIVDLWRNDAIKHVREAAELALSRIGGEEAERAIKVTKVLSEEMTNLRATRQQ